MDTQQSFAYALANNSKTLVLLLSPFPCVACSPVSLYVGLIEALWHVGMYLRGADLTLYALLMQRRN